MGFKITMSLSIEDRCRRVIARLFNEQPTSIWLPNKNDGLGYVSGRPDGEARLPGGRFVDIECKGDSGSLYLGDPEQPLAAECRKLGRNYDASGWHANQRNFWQRMCEPFHSPYYIAALVAASRDRDERFDYEAAGLFLVPPQAWLGLEAKVSPRKTVALSPTLERIIANRSITLESEWQVYRLAYEGGRYRIPVTHPIYSLIFPEGGKTCEPSKP